MLSYADDLSSLQSLLHFAVCVSDIYSRPYKAYIIVVVVVVMIIAELFCISKLSDA